MRLRLGPRLIQAIQVSREMKRFTASPARDCRPSANASNRVNGMLSIVKSLQQHLTSSDYTHFSSYDRLQIAFSNLATPLMKGPDR